MKGRSECLLVLVLTRRCDRRCGFCPQSFEERDMSVETLDAALRGLLPRLAPPARVKLFGGEPLLRPDLVTRTLDHLDEWAPGMPVELPTHGRGLSAVLERLYGRPGVEVFASRLDARAARLAGAVHNFLIPPGEAPAKTSRRLLGACALGFRRFNVLPAYFTRWTPGELEGLAASFRALRRVFERLAAAGRPVELVNLARRGSTPLYNDGLVVDVDGRVYSSNLVLTRAVGPKSDSLWLGNVEDPDGLAERARANGDEILAECFLPEVLADTRAVDEALSAFCRAMEEA